MMAFRSRQFSSERGSMGRVIQPSRDAMQKAWALGRRMAQIEPHIRPLPSDAATFKKYEEFRLVHRSRLESREHFAKWEEAAQALAEREARRMGLKVDSSTGLDILIVKLLMPMKHAFWLGWESARGLEKMYMELRQRSLQAPDAPVRVFAAAQLAERVQKPDVEGDSDEGFWMSVTGQGETIRDKNRPQVLAATALVNLNQPQPEHRDAAIGLTGVDVDDVSAEAILPGQARENPARVVLEDDDMPDPYAT
jgi:hypothetical protein